MQLSNHLFDNANLSSIVKRFCILCCLELKHLSLKILQCVYLAGVLLLYSLHNKTSEAVKNFPHLFFNLYYETILSIAFLILLTYPFSISMILTSSHFESLYISKGLCTTEIICVFSFLRDRIE